jgi:hypothetical protein
LRPDPLSIPRASIRAQARQVKSVGNSALAWQAFRRAFERWTKTLKGLRRLHLRDAQPRRAPGK